MATAPTHFRRTLASRLGQGAFGGLALLAAGAVLRPVEAPAWRTVARAQPVFEQRSLEVAAGQGLLLGLLGGFRAVGADLLWLRANAQWEAADLAATHRTLRLVTAVDPRPLGFWVNGARMIGYDMPGWRIDAAGGCDAVPATVQRRIDEEQAALALAHLEQALVFHPGHPLIYVEMANLHLHRRNDLGAAAAFFKLAAQQPKAPRFAARIHAELLQRLGRDREAYAWLVALHPTLPVDEPAARAEVVLARIHVLEEKLAVPGAERYRPGRP